MLGKGSDKVPRGQKRCASVGRFESSDFLSLFRHALTIHESSPHDTLGRNARREEFVFSSRR